MLTVVLKLIYYLNFWNYYRYLLSVTPLGPGQSVKVSKYVLTVTLLGKVGVAKSVTVSKLSL